MGYRPNLMARSLRQRKTKAIGLLFKNMTYGYAQATAVGVKSALRAKGYRVMIGLSSYNPQDEACEVELMLDCRIDGLICAPILGSDAIYQQIINQGLPLVFICECLDLPGVSWVGLDGADAARQLTEHMIKLGHRRIAFVTPDCVYKSQVLLPRLEAYQATMAENGLPVSEELLGLGRLAEFEAIPNATDRLMALEKPPTAILAISDVVAYQVMDRLMQRGYRIPQDISVAGISNLDPSNYEMIQLTTINEDTYQIGKKAAEIVLEQVLDGKKSPRHELIRGQLIPRRSTGPAPSGNIDKRG